MDADHKYNGAVIEDDLTDRELIVMSEIGQIDKNLQVNGTIQGEKLVFHNARNSPFKVYGLLNGKEGEPYRRLPLRLAEQVNEGVLRLHRHTAGGRVRFATDSDCVAILAIMPKKHCMPHMPLLGSSGFDLYEQEADTCLYRGSFIPSMDGGERFESIIRFDESKKRDLIVHFPLYDSVDDLFIGIRPNSVLDEGECYRNFKPILYYGSSITQGGCASRPGNCYTNIISRNLNVDHINLGFSGSGRGEMLMSDYIAKQDMSVFLYDYDHNAPSAEYLAQTHEAFFLNIRDKNPDLPVIMASRTDTPKTQSIACDTLRRRDVILKTYENAKKRGDQNVLFVDGMLIFEQSCNLGVAADSCTVDGIHPNDLGFACIAKVFEEAIRKTL